LVEGAGQVLGGPSAPTLVVGEQVEKHVGVHDGAERQSQAPVSGVAARQCHDLVSAHRHLTAAAHPTDQTSTAAFGSPYEPHHVVEDLELDFTAWLDAQPPTNVLRDRHLSLARHRMRAG